MATNRTVQGSKLGMSRYEKLKRMWDRLAGALRRWGDAGPSTVTTVILQFADGSEAEKQP